MHFFIKRTISEITSLSVSPVKLWQLFLLLHRGNQKEAQKDTEEDKYLIA
jgi:hypothetical protein